LGKNRTGGGRKKRREDPEREEFKKAKKGDITLAKGMLETVD